MTQVFQVRLEQVAYLVQLEIPALLELLAPLAARALWATLARPEPLAQAELQAQSDQMDLLEVPDWQDHLAFQGLLEELVLQAFLGLEALRGLSEFKDQLAEAEPLDCLG